MCFKAHNYYILQIITYLTFRFFDIQSGQLDRHPRGLLKVYIFNFCVYLKLSSLTYIYEHAGGF